MANQSSQEACTRCPSNSQTAAAGASSILECICDAGFFQDVSDGITDTLNCEPCMLGANCTTAGATLQTLRLESGWWRVANTSRDVRQCLDDDDVSSPGCVGLSFSRQCKPGLSGPYCSVCAHQDGNYFDGSSRACKSCDSAGVSPLAIVLLIALPVLGLFGLLRHWRVGTRLPPGVLEMSARASQLGLKNKLKLIISMYQVCRVVVGPIAPGLPHLTS